MYKSAKKAFSLVIYVESYTPQQKKKTKNHKTTFRNGFYRKLSLNKSLDFFSFQTYKRTITLCAYVSQTILPWYYTIHTPKYFVSFVYIYACSVSCGALSFLLWRARLPQSAVFYNKFFNIHSGMVLRRVWALIFPKKKKNCICISAVIMCRRSIVLFFYPSLPCIYTFFPHFHISQFRKNRSITEFGKCDVFRL